MDYEILETKKIPHIIEASVIMKLWKIECACFGKDAHFCSEFRPRLEDATTIICYDRVNDAIYGFISGRICAMKSSGDGDFLYFYVNYIEVLPEFQKRGIGRELLKKLEAFLRPLKVDTIFLNCRSSVAQFYKNCDFEEVDEKGHLYGKMI
jgi:ribosomal protein S18 acetylase RimI-like enzyme